MKEGHPPLLALTMEEGASGEQMWVASMGSLPYNLQKGSSEVQVWEIIHLCCLKPPHFCNLLQQP